jgi:hypothetical protein
MRDFLPRIIQAFGKFNVKGMFQFFSNRIFGYYFAAFYFFDQRCFFLDVFSQVLLRPASGFSSFPDNVIVIVQKLVF